MVSMTSNSRTGSFLGRDASAAGTGVEDDMVGGRSEEEKAGAVGLGREAR